LIDDDFSFYHSRARALVTVGFFLGEWIANIVGLSILNLGDLNLVEGTLVCWVGLFAARAWRRG
jgi:hypothetical protein